MARQQYRTNPWEKHLETYSDFSAGLNTVASNDTMQENELRIATNVDLSERGAIKRRKGMTRHLTPGRGGLGQGYFRFYKEQNDYVEVVAVDGKFVIGGATKTIEGLTEGFQNTRPIEGVQFGNKMYFATGTKLVEFDGEDFKVTEPYAPEPLEALYIGTNGLADDPNNFMQDGESTFIRIDGVTFSERYGIVNQSVTLTAYSSKPVEKQVEFQFEWRYAWMEEGKWVLGQDWSSEKTWEFSPDVEGDFQFRINIREKGNTVAETQYLVPKYKVNPSKDSSDVEIDTSYIHRCNRILLHWNRLVMYGDEQNPDMIYISHLNNPNYFPVPNTLRFENGKKEALTTLVQYRDMLIAFTATTIQALHGKSPADFRRTVLNTSIGCVAPYSAVVVRNHIFFLSTNGVYFLKSVGYVEDKANVEKLDSKIDNVIPRDPDACALLHNNQYYIIFPSKNIGFRFYTELNAWASDESEKLDFHRMYSWDNKLFGQSKQDGIVLVHDDVYDDDGHVYKELWETAFFTFGQPYHSKKLKELQITTEPEQGTIRAHLHVFADAASIFQAEGGEAFIDENGDVGWKVDLDPNLKSEVITYGGTVLGEWEMGKSPFGEVGATVQKIRLSGKCLRSKIKFEHEEAKAAKVNGIAYIFKTKKP